MIELTRLNHQSLILNSDLIKFIEHAHDTVVTLLNGEKLMVAESPDEILDRIRAYRAEQGATAAEAGRRSRELLSLVNDESAPEVEHG